jgi:PAS domain S-box-containing protein
MKGKTQKSKVELVGKLTQQLREQVELCIQEDNESNLTGFLKAELDSLLKALTNDSESKQKTDFSEDNLQETNNSGLHILLNRTDIANQVELTKDSIWLIDIKYNLVFANNHFKQNFKLLYNHNPRIGTNILDTLSPKEKKKWEKRFDKVLSGENLVVVDKYEMDNQKIYAETFLNALITEDRIAGISCLTKNITDKKLIEIALLESEKRYQTLISNIPCIFYRCAYDKAWTMEIISDEIERVSGYPADHFIGNKIRSYASIIHPDDRLLVESTVAQSILQKKDYEMEYRLLHADGTTKWVNEKGRAQYDLNGNVARLDGFINEVTKRKIAENALRQSEEKYRHIFLSINDLFIKTDQEGIITLVTPSIESILGYLPEEAIGKNITSFLKFPIDYMVLTDKLKDKKSIKEFETIFKSKFNEEITVSINARIILDANNNLTGFEGIARDISERKIVEQSLKARTKELYSILDNAPVILILADEFGEIININRATTRFGSKEQQEILNQLSKEALRCIMDIQHSTGCGKSKDCDQCVVRNTFVKTIQEKKNFHQVEGMMTAQINNEVLRRQVLISTTYIDFENTNRVLLSLDDITELSATQEQIRKLSGAVEQSTATILITDTEGNIEYANPEFERSTGYALKEVLGKNPRIIKSQSTDPEIYKKLWKTILSGQTWQGEFLNTKKDGTEYWENAIISPIFNNVGKIISFIAVKDDITERKRIQEELIRSEKELRQLNHEKSRYFSILAHDLRGLVGALYSYAHLLSDEFDHFSKDEFREQVNILVKSSRDSLSLLDNLLEWARASLGSMSISYEKLNLYEVAKSVVDYLYDLAKSKGIDINLTIKKDIDLVTDKNVINTIVRNLIGNAIKFTPSGGNISIYSNFEDNDYIEISIQDTGIGMSDETKNKLFKAGENIIRPGTNKEKGTGLGLMICYEMANRLGGSIHVESELGNGSRFFFRLPLKEKIE